MTAPFKTAGDIIDGEAKARLLCLQKKKLSKEIS